MQHETFFSDKTFSFMMINTNISWAIKEMNICERNRNRGLLNHKKSNSIEKKVSRRAMKIWEGNIFFLKESFMIKVHLVDSRLLHFLVCPSLLSISVLPPIPHYLINITDHVSSDRLIDRSKRRTSHIQLIGNNCCLKTFLHMTFFLERPR